MSNSWGSRVQALLVASTLETVNMNLPLTKGRKHTGARRSHRGRCRHERTNVHPDKVAVVCELEVGYRPTSLDE